VLRHAWCAERVRDALCAEIAKKRGVFFARTRQLSASSLSRAAPFPPACVLAAFSQPAASHHAMSAQLSAPDAGEDTPLTFASLPRALQCEVFARAPVDARARAACVCHAWCEVLSEHSLWTRLDLSPKSGVARTRVTDALLRGAARKARGSLTALDVSDCERLTHEALLEAVTANAGALTELRLSMLRSVTAEQLAALLGAAPLLHVCHADAQAEAPVACRMLRNEPLFGPLRLQTLFVHQWPGGEADVHALAADMTGSASPLLWLGLSDAPLGVLGVLDAFVDAALARQLPNLAFSHSSLSHTSVPALARLLGGSALLSLAIESTGPEPLLMSGEEGSAALLAAALRANKTLKLLALRVLTCGTTSQPERRCCTR
jgi:hypothetical protein